MAPKSDIPIESGGDSGGSLIPGGIVVSGASGGVLLPVAPISPGTRRVAALSIGSPLTAVIAVDDTPLMCPARPLTQSERLYVRPLPTNGAEVRIADYRQAVISGPSDYIAAGDPERELLIDNIGKLWINGKKDDGVIFVVRPVAR